MPRVTTNKKNANQFCISFKKSVDPRVIEFCNKQTNLSDTMLYLIENEISNNGIRNLQEYIPPIRQIREKSNVSTEEKKIEIETKTEENENKINLESVIEKTESKEENHSTVFSCYED